MIASAKGRKPQGKRCQLEQGRNLTMIILFRPAPAGHNKAVTPQQLRNNKIALKTNHPMIDG